MKIGELTARAATNVETVRYYERVGLMPPPARTAANYPSYSRVHLDRLVFIRYARGLGFKVVEMRSLLDLSDNPERDCADADRIASAHLASMDAKIASLTALRSELARMVGLCRGGQASDCRVLEVIADHARCAADHGVSSRRRPGMT